MAPIRRYLRITQYSVLECRIYLDNPALAESWLLNTRRPVLPRVIESIRPLVLPKLREENERGKGKGASKKKKGVKDVVVEDDFEVSVFLTETSSRHSLLTKQKHFHEPNKAGMQSNSSKLTGATNDTAIDVENAPVILREDSEEARLSLQDLPTAETTADNARSDTDDLFLSEDEIPRRSKRPRAPLGAESDSGSTPELEPIPKRRKDDEVMPDEDEEATDDKKKMAMKTSYDGFSIYGRVLCLVIKRRDKKGKNPATSGGQTMMEDFITSTQMPPQEAE